MSETNDFGWWHKNAFFEITPFTGWGFVYLARTVKEIIFWYSLIFIFLGITIYNVQSLTALYLSMPTRTTVLLGTSTNNLSLENIEITLKLPLSELFSQLPIRLSLSERRNTEAPNWSKWAYGKSIYETAYGDINVESKTQPGLKLVHDYLCQPYELHQMPLEDRQEHQKLRKHPNLLDGKITIKQRSEINSISDRRVLAEWNRIQEDAKDAVSALWEQILTDKDANKKRKHYADKLNELTYKIIKQRANDTLYKLFALERTAEQDGGGYTANIVRKLNATVSDLFANLINELGQIIQITVEPESRVIIKDWFYIERDIIFFPHDAHVFKFLVQPYGHTRKLNIRVYSFIHMWYQRLLTALQETSNNHFYLLACDNDGPPFYEQFNDLMISLLIDYYMEYSKMHIQIGDGDSNHYVPSFFRNILTAVPSMHFSSKVNRWHIVGNNFSCYNESFTKCLQDCYGERYLSECHCHPWTHTNDVSVPMCDHYCPPADPDCATYCNHKIRHPCYLLLLSDTHSQILTGEKLSLPSMQLYGVEISIPETYNFVQCVEEYSLSARSFLSLLGGVLESWSGINVLGFIHLVIFFITRLIRLPARNTIHVEQAEPEISFKTVEKELEGSLESLEAYLNDNKSILKRISDWLKSNTLYEQTPMTGYTYIVNAHGTCELVFWYFSIGLFAFIAIFDVYGLLNQYASQKPSTTVVLGSSVESLSVPNVSFTFNLPIFEFSPIHQGIPLHYELTKFYKIDEMWDLNLYADLMTSAENLTDSVVNNYYKFLTMPWPQLISNRSGAMSNTVHLSDPSTLAEWNRRISESLSDLKKLETTKWQIDPVTLQQRMFSLFMRPLIKLDRPQLLYKLLLLEFLKSGISPHELIRQALHISMQNQAPDLTEWHELSAEVLLTETMQMLSEMIHISIDPQSASATLNGFVLNSIHLFGNQVTFEVSISLPTKQQSLHVSVYSLLNLWISRFSSWVGVLEVNDYNDRLYLNAELLHGVARDLGYYYSESTGQIFDIPLPTLNSVHCLIQPRWQMLSQVKNCQQYSMSTCQEECLLNAYRKQGNCEPWFLNTDDMSNRRQLCNKPFVPANVSSCISECKPCDTQHFDFNLGFYSEEGHIDGPLFECQCNIASRLYPQFNKEYDMSIGVLMAELGASLDFWVGLNVLAMAHLLVYILKQCFCSTDKSLPDQAVISLEQKRKRVRKVRKEIKVKIGKLRHLAKTHRIQNRSRFGWFWRSGFLSETSMTGFSFIANAKSYFEIVSWWMLIVVFCSITVINVSNAILAYSSRPVRTTVGLERVQNSQIGNLSWNFEMDFMELATHNLLFTSLLLNEQLEDYSGSIGEYFACAIADPIMLDLIRETVFAEWVELLKKSWNFENIAEINDFTTLISSEETLKTWTMSLSKGTEHLMSFLQQNAYKDWPKKRYDQRAWRREFHQLLQSPYNQSYDAYAQLLFLEALNSGWNPKEKLFEMLSNPDYDLFLQTGQPPLRNLFLETAEQILTQANIETIFKQVHLDLSKVVNVRVSNATGVQIILRDWGFTVNPDFYPYGVSQKFQFAVIVPAGVWDQLCFEIRFFSDMWHEKILNTFRNFYGNQHICNSMHMDTIYEARRSEIVHYFGSGQVTILDSNSQIRYSKGGRQTFVQTPEAQFYSETDNCAKSSSNCVDQCVSDAHLKVCACIPWEMIYLYTADSDEPVCTSNCELSQQRLEQCRDECAEKNMHPCNTTLLTVAVQPYYYSYDYGSTVQSFCIQNAQEDTTVKVFTETYEFTLGRLVAQLGGLLDLWLGVNLLSIIHLLYYIFKHSGIRSTTTRRSALLRIKKLEQRLMTKIDNICGQLEKENVDN